MPSLRLTRWNSTTCLRILPKPPRQTRIRQQGMTTLDNTLWKRLLNKKIKNRHTENARNKEIWWNMPIRTANKVEYNRPDVVMWNRETEVCHLVEISVPLDSNISNRQVVKSDKYMPMVSEMQQLQRNYTFQIIPVIIGCLGAIPKSLEQNLKKLGLEDATYKSLIKKLQKTALLGSVKIMKTFIRMWTANNSEELTEV